MQTFEKEHLRIFVKLRLNEFSLHAIKIETNFVWHPKTTCIIPQNLRLEDKGK